MVGSRSWFYWLTSVLFTKWKGEWICAEVALTKNYIEVTKEEVEHDIWWFEEDESTPTN